MQNRKKTNADSFVVVAVKSPQKKTSQKKKGQVEVSKSMTPIDRLISHTQRQKKG